MESDCQMHVALIHTDTTVVTSSTPSDTTEVLYSSLATTEDEYIVSTTSLQEAGEEEEEEEEEEEVEEEEEGEEEEEEEENEKYLTTVGGHEQFFSKLPHSTETTTTTPLPMTSESRSTAQTSTKKIGANIDSTQEPTTIFVEKLTGFVGSEFMLVTERNNSTSGSHAQPEATRSSLDSPNGSTSHASRMRGSSQRNRNMASGADDTNDATSSGAGQGGVKGNSISESDR